MRLRSMAIVALALGCAHAPPPNDAATQHPLIDLEQRLLAAIRARDGSALETMLAPDFRRYALGEVPQPRARFIEEVLATPGTVVSLEAQELRVQRVGELAAIMGVEVRQLRRPDGQNLFARTAFTELARPIDGRWQLVLAHEVPLR